ncbi:MAG: hypothetical protein ACI86P_002681, partial [Flavobacteriales bacterium]
LFSTGSLTAKNIRFKTISKTINPEHVITRNYALRDFWCSKFRRA